MTKQQLKNATMELLDAGWEKIHSVMSGDMATSGILFLKNKETFLLNINSINHLPLEA